MLLVIIAGLMWTSWLGFFEQGTQYVLFSTAPFHRPTTARVTWKALHEGVGVE